MKARFVLAAFAVAALAPLGAAHAGGVSFSISTPEIGIRVGPPVFGPVFAPVPVVVPVPSYPAYPVYAPAPVYLPRPVFVPPPRVVYPRPVFYPRPVVVVPRVVHPRGYGPAPRLPYYGPHGQQAGYRVPPPGHVNRYGYDGRYQ